ncbi:MAG: glycerol-3-phosphate 1-O-acyltransferase PlsY [Lachnospiraceae bacterium]|nr:glycerol-3-phosphate 1-O-acyltransferase PlsY [Lachnospiraceae bacterium]
MLLFQSILLCLLAGYILGGISGGHIAGKLYKTDVREHGSGNLGATNVLRTLGAKAAVLTLAIDVLKVIIPVLVVRYVLFPQYEPFSYENQLLVLYIAFGAVIGHNFPMTLNFHGGKGVACLAATILMFDFRMAVVELVVFILLVALTRYVSLGSIVVSVIFFVWIYIVHDATLHMALIAAAFPVSVIFMHRSNIVRLIHGTENKIGSKKK